MSTTTLPAPIMNTTTVTIGYDEAACRWHPLDAEHKYLYVQEEDELNTENKPSPCFHYTLGVGKFDIKNSLLQRQQECQQVPNFLKPHNVPDQTWQLIVDSFATTMIPAIDEFYTKMDKLFRIEHKEATKMKKKVVPGIAQQQRQWVNTTRTVHSHEWIVEKVAQLQSKLLFVATSFEVFANDLLNNHGIRAELSYTLEEMSKHSRSNTTTQSSAFGVHKVEFPSGVTFRPIEW